MDADSWKVLGNEKLAKSDASRHRLDEDDNLKYSVSGKLVRSLYCVHLIEFKDIQKVEEFSVLFVVLQQVNDWHTRKKKVPPA